MTLGYPRLHLRCTDSTNERARALAIAGAPHGTLVSAAEQTAGRGRQGRRWSAPRGSSLLMSLVLRPSPADCVPPTSGSAGGAVDRSWPTLPLAAAVAVCDVAGPATRVKWPNDVVVEREPRHGSGAEPRRGSGAEPRRGSGAESRSESAATDSGGLAKLAGILVESRSQQGWAVLGIGLNVAVRIADLPAELRETAATLACGPDAIEPLLARLLGALEQRLGAPREQTLEAWRARDALRGREIAWAAGHGRAEGIDAAGHLIVALPDGERTALAAGEVHLGAPMR